MTWNTKTRKQDILRSKPLEDLLFLKIILEKSVTLSLKRHQQLEAAGKNKMPGSYLKADSRCNYVNINCLRLGSPSSPWIAAKQQMPVFMTF